VGIVSRLLGERDNPAAHAGRRLHLEDAPEAIYAIGDVHGCAGLLRRLQAVIDADAVNYRSAATILLGDVIDRGPASAQVLDELVDGKRPQHHPRFCLAGNHEALMLDFVRRPTRHAPWLTFGGVETLASYGIPLGNLNRAGAGLAQLVESHIPREHLDFLAGLPVMITTEATAFVHAGVRPGVNLEQQSDTDLLWYRDDFAGDYSGFDKCIVHGHTPLRYPLVTEARIAVDTGAYLSGRLSAVRLTADGAPKLLAVAALSHEPARNTRPAAHLT
jgi:serine/threonine protein phosphatase 1